MTLPSDDELAARNCLRVGSYLVHPKYLPAESDPYGKFKERCRACWHLRAHFPDWVLALIESWKAEGKAVQEEE